MTGPARGSRTYRKLPRDQWIAVPIPDAGIPLEWVVWARETLDSNPAPAFGGAREWEMTGGIAVCGECGGKMSTDQSGGKYFYYVCAASRSRDGRTRKCDGVGSHRAEPLEEAVVSYVDGELLTDREELERQMDGAIERERAAFRNPDATVEVWMKKIAECDRKREKNQEMVRADAMTLEELKASNTALDQERRIAEEALSDLSEAASRVEDMEKAKRAILEMWGTGLTAGVHWFPPRLRRQVYSLLRLRVEVFADKTLTIEGKFDADLMRLTPEVEAWAEELRMIDERLEAQEREDPASGYEVELPNPDGRGSSTLHVSARHEQLERLERELGLLRQRFRTTDTTSGCGSPRSRGRCRPQRGVYR